VGGIARATNFNPSVRFDAIVTVGNDGHLYQYASQSNSAYAWSDLGIPPGCDAVVGNPSVTPAVALNAPNNALNIVYRCNNNHLGRAVKTGLSAWTFVDVGAVPTGASADPAAGLAGSYIYTVGYDGGIYRCYEGNTPGCALAGANNVPYGTRFTGSPAVVVSRTAPTTQWLLVADTAGNLWQFDAYNGWWSNLGQPTCGPIEGDVAATVDDASNYWIAAARCSAEDKIAVYTKSGSRWQASDTVSPGLPLSKPSVATYPYNGISVTNVSFQTVTGEQRLLYYYPTRAEWSWGSATP
jgi:hypothetical protein